MHRFACTLIISSLGRPGPRDIPVPLGAQENAGSPRFVCGEGSVEPNRTCPAQGRVASGSAVSRATLGFKTEGASVHALRPSELATLQSRVQGIEVFPPSCHPRARFLSPRWSLLLSHLLGFRHAQQVPHPQILMGGGVGVPWDCQAEIPIGDMPPLTPSHMSPDPTTSSSLAEAGQVASLWMGRRGGGQAVRTVPAPVVHPGSCQPPSQQRKVILEVFLRFPPPGANAKALVT